MQIRIGKKWALCLLCQAPATHQAISMPKFTAGEAALKNIYVFPNWIAIKHWTKNKWPSSAKFSESLAWKPLNLPSQLCESRRGLGLCFLLCQLPAVWSWASCSFSPWPQFPIGVLKEKEPTADIKDSKWQTTAMRRLKLDWHKEKRLLLILYHPSKRKKKRFLIC